MTISLSMTELRHRERYLGAPGEVVQIQCGRELVLDRLDDLLQCVAADRARERHAQKEAAGLVIAIDLGLADIAAALRESRRHRRPDSRLVGRAEFQDEIRGSPNLDPAMFSQSSRSAIGRAT